jgi:tetratricopeptide (TPR) repeat protein
MRWLQTEYILKGIFLGLVLFAALQQAVVPPASWLDTLVPVNLCALGGLVVALVLAAVVELREGFRPRGQYLAYILFLLLECPTLVYAGIIGGMLAGNYLIRREELDHLAITILGGGAALGIAFGQLRQVKERRARIVIILALGAVLVGGALYWAMRPESGEFIKDPALFAVQLLLGIPLFYLLTFSGHEEESEVEIGAMCGFLCLGISILTHNMLQVRMAAVVIPAFLYLWYTMRILPGLRVLKHAFRGLSYLRVGRLRLALLAFRRALQLDPTSNMARDGFWEVHRSLDLQKLAHDPETLALVDFDLCLDRAGTLLQSKPTPRQLDEALRLLDLVLSQRPQLQPAADYWHAVAHTHNRELDQAVARLERVLNPEHYGANNPHRLRILTPAWELALLLHGELRRRVGEPHLALPQARMDAIRAVERHLAESPEDPTARQLKLALYQGLTEAEFADGPPKDPERPAPEGPVFDHIFAMKLGLQLIQDPEHWQRGAEFLRMAITGLPAQATGLYVKIAQACERAGKPEEAIKWFEKARDAGWAIGWKNLPDTEAKYYFSTLKYLGEVAMHHGNVEAAVDNFRLYSESPSAGVETLRTLSGLYEQKGDFLSALRTVETAMVYNSSDKDLLERRDRYLYNLPPEQLAARLDLVKNSFDVPYCLTRAKTILDAPYSSELEWLDVARHMVALARVVKPGNVQGRVLDARVKLRYGERDAALAVLEELRANKPASFETAEDEDAWFVSCQILGDLYLEVGKPDLAVPCYQDFRKSARSGARTYYKLGQAYEQLGDTARAVKCYKQVTGYEGNPLTSDAYDALHRLGA